MHFEITAVCVCRVPSFLPHHPHLPSKDFGTLRWKSALLVCPGMTIEKLTGGAEGGRVRRIAAILLATVTGPTLVVFWYKFRICEENASRSMAAACWQRVAM